MYAYTILAMLMWASESQAAHGRCILLNSDLIACDIGGCYTPVPLPFSLTQLPISFLNLAGFIYASEFSRHRKSVDDPGFQRAAAIRANLMQHSWKI